MPRHLRLLTILLLALLGLCSACSDDEPPAAQALLDQDFPEIVAQAKGQTVHFYMFGGWAHVNEWVDEYVAPEVQKRYGVTLERVPMDAAIFVNKLLSEKAAGSEQGTIDLIWVNGENFKNLMEAGLMFGPFADKLPNEVKYVDSNTVAYDFGYPVRGYEAPWGRAQFVFEYDSARTPEVPTSFAELTEWVKAHPGMFTYPQPPDFTGSAFIRQAFYAVTGGYEQYMQGYDEELFAKNAPKLWAYLNELKPYLWQEGRSYPRDSAALDTLFARGEVDMAMSYHPSHAQSKIIDGTYPPSARTFVMHDGSIYNTHFTAIPANAVNKAGAMVVADFLLSPEAQLSKYDPANWGDFPAIDLEKLLQEWRERFAAVDLGQATLEPQALAEVAVPEIPSAYLEKLESGWEENVLR